MKKAHRVGCWTYQLVPDKKRKAKDNNEGQYCEGNCNYQLQILDMFRIKQPIYGGGLITSLQVATNFRQKPDEAGPIRLRCRGNPGCFVHSGLLRIVVFSVKLRS